MRILVVLLVLVALLGGGAWLATQPAGEVQSVQPSSVAVIKAEAEIFAALKAAEVKAVLTRSPQTVQVNLSDLELTSLVDSRLAQSSTSLHDAVLRGGSDGAFHATVDADWNGLTLRVAAAGTVTFAEGGAIQLDVRDASVGRLPLPGSLANSLVAQSQSAATVNIPPGITNLSLEPVPGGAILSATASPSISSLAA